MDNLSPHSYLRRNLRRLMHRLKSPVPNLNRTERNIRNTRPRHHYAKLYGSVAWQQLRAETLRLEPLCRKCGKVASTVDHIQPHNGDDKLFHEPSNLQSLCKECHTAKSRKGL